MIEMQYAMPLPGMQFPERNETVKAQWSPIFLEPMVGSGEKLCVGIAVENSETGLILPATGVERLRCLYGREEMEFIQAMANIVVANLEDNFSSSVQPILHEWRSPVEGFTLGPIRQGAGASMEEIGRRGLMLCASLVEKLVDESENSETTLSRKQVEEQIKHLVLLRNPHMEKSFGVKKRFLQDTRAITYGYAGLNLAANFGVVHRNDIAGSVGQVKASLLDLRLFKSKLPASAFDRNPQRHLMLVYSSDPADPLLTPRKAKDINEAINELDMQAQGLEIEFAPANDVNTLAERLLQSAA